MCLEGVLDENERKGKVESLIFDMAGKSLI